MSIQKSGFKYSCPECHEITFKSDIDFKHHVDLLHPPFKVFKQKNGNCESAVDLTQFSCLECNNKITRRTSVIDKHMRQHNLSWESYLERFEKELAQPQVGIQGQNTVPQVFDEDVFIMRLAGLRGAKSEILKLGEWCLSHPKSVHKMIRCIEKSMQNATDEHNLILFYLLNELGLQSSREKMNEFNRKIGKSIFGILRKNSLSKLKTIKCVSIWRKWNIFDKEILQLINSVYNEEVEDEVKNAQVERIDSVHTVEDMSIESEHAGDSIDNATRPSLEERLRAEFDITLDMDEDEDDKIEDEKKVEGIESVHTILIEDGDLTELCHKQKGVCQYPSPPQNGGVVITMDDFRTLRNGKFINDKIVDFYASYLYDEMIQVDKKEKVLVMGSFFYNRLSTEYGDESIMDIHDQDSLLSLAERRHSRVKLWTKNSKLCLKHTIIIPICLNSHWFIVVIAFVSGRYNLLVMDSMGGDNKMVVNLLKEYFEIQLKKEMGDRSLKFLQELTIRWLNVPQQDNKTDCGLFLLHYVEKILERYTFYLKIY